MLQYQSFCIHEIIGCDLHLLANFLGLNEEIRKQKNNQKIIEQCLKLLESCVNFQFNISYYDFELDSDLKEQNTPIFFPDKVVEQFSNIHLLELLFVNNIQMIQDGNELSVILTKCLAKIASCKLYLIDGKENKKQFTFTLFKYISLTLQKIIEIGAQVRDLAEQEITIVILELASRFINNATLTKIRKFQELHNFFQCLQQFTILVINTTKIHLKNDSIPTIIDIYGKMVKQSLDQKLDDGIRQQLQNYVREIFQQFIARVQQVEDIVEDIDIKSSKFMKNVLKDYFTDFYSMLAQSLPQNLQIFANFFSECIKNYIDIFNQQNTKYLKILQQCLILCFGFITNIILQNQTLEFMFNYSNHGQNQDQLQIIAKILSDALILIDFLNQKFQENAQFYNQHFEMTLLIFSEEFMDTTLGQSYQSYEMFSEAQNIGFKLINNILKFFPKKSNIMEISNIFFDKIEKSIMYEDQLYQNKVAKNENQQQQQSPLIKYILKISKNLICRLKNNLSRSEFKQLQMVQKFQSLLLNLADQTFDKNYFLKQRIILFEIISYIMFDDLCDAYINNIIELVAKISFMNKNTQDKNLQQKNIIKFMYDCSGIVNIIDVPTIFKLTLKRINPLLKTLYTPEIFQNQELIIPSLKLMKAITYNRAINISHYTFTGLQYELFNDFAQYIIALNQLLLKLDDRERKQIKANRILKLQWEIILQLNKWKCINFTTFSYFKSGLLKEYIKSILDVKFLYFDYIFSYQKLTYYLINNFQKLCDNFKSVLLYEMDHYYIMKIIEYSIFYLKKMSQLNNELTKDNQQSQQFYTSQIQKDILVQNTCSVFQIICAYIYEEIFISKNQNSINIPNLEQNKQILQNIITVGQQSFQQLTFLLLELCFMCEGTHLYLQLQNSLFTCFLIDPNMFHEVKNKYILQQLFSGNEQSVVYQKITERMSQIFADIQPLNDQYNNDLFYNNFKFVIQQFKKETQTINVEQNQQNKISIHY